MLEAVIKYRWMALPQEQREGIKNYVATVVIKARARTRAFEAPTVSAEPSFLRRTRALRCPPAHALTPARHAPPAARRTRAQMSGDEATFRRDRAYISKLNTILVAVLKQEWPARWPTFIADLVAAAKSSETLCENCMHILKARRARPMRPMRRARALVCAASGGDETNKPQ